jgi:hypothetical protein
MHHTTTWSPFFSRTAAKFVDMAAEAAMRKFAHRRHSSAALSQAESGPTILRYTCDPEASESGKSFTCSKLVGGSGGWCVRPVSALLDVLRPGQR